MSFPPERQVTTAHCGHILTNAAVWSPDSEWIVYDTRSDPAGDCDRTDNHLASALGGTRLPSFALVGGCALLGVHLAEKLFTDRPTRDGFATIGEHGFP